MPSTVPTHFAKKFDTNVQILAQRLGGELPSTCQMKNLDGAEEATFDQIGDIEAVEITSRHADTIIQEREHLRRWVGARDFSAAELYDWTDDFRMLSDLSSPYVKGQAMAMGRKKDDLIRDAFSAQAKTDRTGSTLISWAPSAYTGSNPTTDQLYIAHDYAELGSVGSTGMNVKKLRAVRRIFGKREVFRWKKRYLVMTDDQFQDLMMDSDLTTIERMKLKALEAGEIPDFYGFNFKLLNSLKTVSETYGSGATDEVCCYAYCEGSMGMAMGKEVNSHLDRRADKNHSLQIATYFSGNATRVDETEIVEIRCQFPAATS